MVIFETYFGADHGYAEAGLKVAQFKMRLTTKHKASCACDKVVITPLDRLLVPDEV